MRSPQIVLEAPTPRTARIYNFPLARRTLTVKRLAAVLVDHGEGPLASDLAVEGLALEALGFGPAKIQVEIAALEAAAWLQVHEWALTPEVAQ